MFFDILGEIHEIEVIASGRRLRMRGLLRELYGPGRWRKLKGLAQVRLPDATIHHAELHWYEAHGIGRRRMKIKRLLD